MRALIIGIDSTIGSQLNKILCQEKWLVYGTSRQIIRNDKIFYLDLINASTFQFNEIVDVVYICAAMTGISSCQDKPLDSYHINVEAPIILAKYFINKGIHVIYLSSNAVFNGLKPKYKTTDATCPNTVYGKHKEQTEKALLKFQDLVTIVRFTKILTPNYSLILNWIDAIQNSKSITVFPNVFLSPIAIDIACDFLKIIAEKKLKGIFHLSGNEDISYMDLAVFLADSMKLNKSLIKFNAMLESTTTNQPRYASLDIGMSEKLINVSNLAFPVTVNGLYKDLF